MFAFDQTIDVKTLLPCPSVQLYNKLTKTFTCSSVNIAHVLSDEKRNFCVPKSVYHKVGRMDKEVKFGHQSEDYLLGYIHNIEENP